MRILAFAYACEPGKGSEPGAGWAWSRMLARLGETWVITRANNRQAIEAHIDRIPERDRLHFVYVDLPPWARSWKRGQRGIRLYYLLWQAAAMREAKRLDRVHRFDLAWHLTLANAWLGSLASLPGRPFVYGPVGGGVRTPFPLIPVLGIRGIEYEALRNGARFLGRYLNPLARAAWRRATLILVQNRETLAWLPRAQRPKAEVFPNVILDELPAPTPSDGLRAGRTALFAGRFLAWKGGALAIRTIRLLPDWRLVLVGSGPDEPRLRRIVSRAGLGDRVVFSPPLARQDLLARMREDADVLLFPSLHDEAGWVVAEAAASGLPVVCLDVGGPPLLGGKAVRPSTPGQTASALAAEAIHALTHRHRGVTDFAINYRAAALSRLLTSRGLQLADSGDQLTGPSDQLGEASRT